MDYIQGVIVAGVAFGQNIIGLITRPYETYRRIVEKGTTLELWYMAVVLGCYFAIASMVKTAAFRPFLLTRQFVLLFASAILGYFLAVLALWVFAKFAGGKGGMASVARAWAYTLIPTTCWFLVTSLLYVVLPPPRTNSTLGIAFSVVFLLFSATMFWWKLCLAYLTLRFSMRLDLAKIVLVTIGSVAVLALYSNWMYTWGIFRVPFL